MIWLDITILALVIIALAILIALFVKYRKKMTMLDLEAMPRAKLRSKKYQLIEKRLARKTTSMSVGIKKASVPLSEGLQKIYHKLQQLERRYSHADKKPQTQEEKEQRRSKVAALLEDGATKFKDENYADAEQVLLDVIRLSPKEIEAYEYLGEIYLARKEYDHAIETLKFARELNPNDDRIYLDLGNVFEQQGSLERATENYKQCVKLAPNNPRNLSALLNVALAKKDRFLARETLWKLKEVNPENQKLAELDAQVKEL
ncbi:MAG: hypothetical protein COW24_01980 [Candidatus Kerfeldbacteria bacterium CG15_BIG_FIL_POST_REV_8_21_14_020_45_12]|uniref:Uncharacterized protein n=1 Tax=Candidatus Kerfeldbacteria bacterium CG15_BIG_FIL_POST_REV_8_21_14_020_45_12 TaxID=2014247 RepID=A0A2M7H4D0_9BACT|nr:MAG: hypothetical protein COW24_01980 [Candidatus Kerfeldbacteria bacterium CG15_BIG_FIL_POST_REV_8_21_14_020_45_12]PJA93615.1 MAG: hypothetical protein CO132_02180 [Candidatus Kerfeldbacteria bacterium CG_4_9_14_3_um_filter_45_8]